MKRSPVALFVILAALALMSAQSRTQARVPVPAAVQSAVAGGGAVNVIVGIDAPFVPEGYLDGVLVARQRDAIARLADDVMARAAGAGAVLGQRLDVLPLFTARVNAAALEALATMPGVKSIEIDGLDRADLLSSVPVTNTPAAWAAGFTGAGWRVAVIDTGVESSHPFLAGKVVSEACYVNAGGAGAGTSTCPGGGFASTAVGSAAPCTATDDCAHGTHVSGIAAGTNGPGGMHGVARGAQIVALQAFTRFDDSTNCGGTPPCALAYTSDQVLALQRAAALAGPGNTGMIAAVNMSLGGGRYFDQASCDAANTSNGRRLAIQNLRSLGVAVVASSGNSSYRDSMGAPGCITEAVSVGSITDAGAVSSFSNNAPFMSLFAPGSDVTSSVTGATYQSYNGTSMAAPHVAGAWAILKQAVPGASVAQVLGALQSTGPTINDTRTGGVSSHPAINVNAARIALAGGAVGAPGAPGTFNASASGSVLSMSWGPPSTGGAATGYTLLVRVSSGGAIIFSLPLGNVTSFSTGAPNGVFYLSVVATNAVGPGPESNVVAVAVPGVVAPPGPPTGLAVVVAGSTATFTWNAPSSGGPVAEYVLAAGFTPGFSTAAVSMPLPPTPTSVAIGGIPPGTYFVRVYARNAGGNSPSSSNEVTVSVAGPTAPGAPVLNTPSVSGGVVSLSWSPGAGGAPTSYTLFASLTSGGAPIATVPLGGTSVSFGGVPPGTYFLRMTATNAVGTSPLSNQVTLVVP
ncbi:MAG: S8 family serine peptidase [Vicinamibacterales bacterium]